MKPTIHLVDVTDFMLPNGTRSADWFRVAFDALGLLDAIDLVVHDGTAGELPGPEAVAGSGRGVIVTGSAGPVFEEKRWIPPLIAFLGEAHRREAWILGVCFGHHALAKALGGTVDWNPRGREMGTVEIFLTPEGEASPLFRAFPSGGLANLVHRTHVVRLPAGAIRLAFNQMTPTQAFQLGKSFGVQPHPEFTPAELAGITELYGRFLIEREHFLDDREHLENFSRTFRDTPAFREVLRNFVEIITG